MQWGQKFGGGHLSKIFGGSETAKFWPNFGQLCNLITNISGTRQDIIEQQTMLQIAISPGMRT